MSIRVIVEFEAMPGARTELASRLESISTTLGPTIPGFLGSSIYEGVDSPDALVEIADWDSADAQAVAVEQAMASGLYAPILELIAAPIKATRLRMPR